MQPSGRAAPPSPGLADLVELCALNAAADTLVAVALANTVFFNVPLGEARDRVALYLLITMAPFALLAPVIGPVLDRLHSRRYGLAATFVFRVVLAWILATRTTGLAVYPVALGTLVMSRGFGIARAAVVPRALPAGDLAVHRELTCLARRGHRCRHRRPYRRWHRCAVRHHALLRVASLLFVVGIVLCIRLPKRVDSAEGEKPASQLPIEILGGGRSRVSGLGGMPAALRGVLPLRALSGFLVIFLAFRLSSGGGRGCACREDRAGPARRRGAHRPVGRHHPGQPAGATTPGGVSSSPVW